MQSPRQGVGAQLRARGLVRGMGGLGGAQRGLWPNGQAGPGGPQPLGRKQPLGKHGRREMVSARQHPLCTPSTPTPGHTAPHTPTLHPSNWSRPHPCSPSPAPPSTHPLPWALPCTPQPAVPPPRAMCVPLQAGTRPSITPVPPWCPQGQAGWRKAVVVTCGPVSPIRGTTGRAPQPPGED